jgi:hypothetical protein
VFNVEGRNHASALNAESISTGVGR